MAEEMTEESSVYLIEKVFSSDKFKKLLKYLKVGDDVNYNYD